MNRVQFLASTWQLSRVCNSISRESNVPLLASLGPARTRCSHTCKQNTLHIKFKVKTKNSFTRGSGPTKPPAVMVRGQYCQSKFSPPHAMLTPVRKRTTRHFPTFRPAQIMSFAVRMHSPRRYRRLRGRWRAGRDSR